MTAVVGDKSSHGGVIITGSTKTQYFGIPVARVGDKVTCPKHGVGTIVSGDPKTNADGVPVATAGLSKTSCGATILPNQFPGR